MWLLHTTTLHLHEFFGANTPPYAILSHTWGSGELVFQDVPLATPATAALHDLELSPALKGKPGFDKVARFCAFVKKWHDYAWVDTCCIDKRSSAELSEAVNSMYKWYRDAQICIVYLADVPPLQQDVTQDDGGYSTWEAAFRASRWFTRGWTLQELIASETRIFVARDWTELDIRQRSRGWHHDLLALVADITGIAEKVLRSRAALPHFCIAERMSWAARRQTTRAEDAAYSLLGLFAVNMPILYGEAGNAFTRLQEELLRRSPDESIFWAAGKRAGGFRGSAAAEVVSV
ncbi:heterokaryon incompatibility protein-domain-containing protein [Massariosphaeria phaeospora]|uniref:Heterokaryon incompatibility protein-domain-containing protein n=1 Tax=Massariosphaeria phaeospora TaxID=100035 RepID=A0A7C8HZV4_9PLEO|nr:heterokaryon incompatibility protein-domain-containing protein [Massariosphaeria phaeospora]